MFSQLSNLHSADCSLLNAVLVMNYLWLREPNLDESKNQTINNFCFWLHLKKQVLHSIRVIMLNKFVVILSWSKIPSPLCPDRQDWVKMHLILRRDWSLQKVVLRPRPISSTSTPRHPQCPAQSFTLSFKIKWNLTISIKLNHIKKEQIMVEQNFNALSQI